MGRLVEIIVAFLFLLTILLEDARPAAGFVGAGPMTREVVQETVEVVAKKFGLKLAGEAGERFSRSAAGFVARYGDDGVKALRSAVDAVLKEGEKVVEFLWKHKYKLMDDYRSSADSGLEIGGGIVREAAFAAGNLTQGVVLSAWEITLKNTPWLTFGISVMATVLLWQLARDDPGRVELGQGHYPRTATRRQSAFNRTGGVRRQVSTHPEAVTI